jgi:hypothetical protein
MICTVPINFALTNLRVSEEEIQWNDDENEIRPKLVICKASKIDKRCV